MRPNSKLVRYQLSFVVIYSRSTAVCWYRRWFAVILCMIWCVVLGRCRFTASRSPRRNTRNQFRIGNESVPKIIINYTINLFFNCNQHFSKPQQFSSADWQNCLRIFYLKKIYVYILALQMASPRNQHCASCIGALSFPVVTKCSSFYFLKSVDLEPLNRRHIYWQLILYGIGIHIFETSF